MDFNFEFNNGHVILAVAILVIPWLVGVFTLSRMLVEALQ
jgi:hypothetical protein